MVTFTTEALELLDKRAAEYRAALREVALRVALSHGTEDVTIEHVRRAHLSYTFKADKLIRASGDKP